MEVTDLYRAKQAIRSVPINGQGDDGVTWRVVDKKLTPSRWVPEGSEARVWRHTAEFFDDEHIYWPTDDELGIGNAVFVRARRDDPGNASVLGQLGANEVRAAIRLGKGVALSISESKLDSSFAEVYLLDTTWGSQLLARIPNATGAPNAFTQSRASKAAKDGVFFSYDGGMLYPEGRVLRWQLQHTSLGIKPFQNAMRSVQSSSHVEPNGLSEAQDEFARRYQCNLCNPRLRRIAQARQYDKIRHRTQKSGYKSQAGALVEYFCPVCQSRARIRALIALLPQIEFGRQKRAGKALLVCAGRAEREFISGYVDSVTHVSLQGDHGDSECQIGIDITRMPTIPSETYRMALACGVLDYIPQIELALKEMFRVLRPGGTFIFYIQPWRLVEKDIRVEVIHENALSYEAYAEKNSKGESGIPDCRFGRRWLHELLVATGFIPRQHSVYDPFGKILLPWFEAQKPG